MDTGCSLLNLTDIDLAAQIGFNYIEFSGRYLAGLEMKDFIKLTEKIEKRGIRCKALNGYCPGEISISGPGFDLGLAKQYASFVAKRAGELGVSLVGIGSPASRNLPGGFDRALARRQLKDFLRVTAEEMDRYGITVCLEALAPCYCNFINYTEESVKIVREIGWQSVKVVLDYYNMEYLKEADMDVTPWLDEIAHVHISDDAGSPFQRDFLREEKSEIHQRRIRRLYSAGYNGTVTIEVDVSVDLKRAEQSLRILRCIKERKENYGI